MGSKRKAAKAARAIAAKEAVRTSVFLPDVAFVSEILSGPSEVSSLSQQIGWQISKHNIPNIWLETQGEGVTVAVLDTGADVHHPDLTGSIARAYDVYNRKEEAVDRVGHGTHCTGIITANNNSIGMVGVAPKAKTMAIKVLGDDGSGTMAGVAAGIRFAIDNKADIISMSLGGSQGDPVLHDVIKEAYNLNIPIICAAGNSGDRGVVAYPARYPETIAIGALNSENLRAEFSQTGTKLDFMAPGVGIFSTYIGGYRVLSGTSMATPWVAGVVALMMAKHRSIGGKTPLRSVEDVREHLRKTTIDLDQAGKDPKTGYGLIDVSKALAEIQPPPEPEPEPDIPEGDSPMPNVGELTTKFNNFVEAYNLVVTARDQTQQQINDLQAQLDTQNQAVAAYDEKAGQISLLLG